MGIKCFAVSKGGGLIAVVEKALTPKITIYRTKDFHVMANITRNAPELGYSAMTFSKDGTLLVTCAEEPELSIVIRDWAKVRSRR